MDEVRIPSAGDGFYAADTRQAQAELLSAAESVLDWLYSRRAHMPEELLDPREARHRRALRAAIKRVSEADGGEDGWRGE